MTADITDFREGDRIRIDATDDPTIPVGVAGTVRLADTRRGFLAVRFDGMDISLAVLPDDTDLVRLPA